MPRLKHIYPACFQVLGQQLEWINPPYAFNRPQRGEAQYIQQWLITDSIQGIVKIQNTISISIQQLIGKAQLGYSKPWLWISQRGKQQFPRRLNIQGGQDVAIGLQGRCYRQIWQIGVFYPTEVTYRVFPPLTAGFSSYKL